MGKKLSWIGSLLLITMLLVACSNDLPVENEDVDVNVPDNEEKENTGDDNVVNAPYSFTEIEVEVDMNGVNDVLEAEYEVERYSIDASYKDKSEDIHLKDGEAMERLGPILDTFTFDENSSEDEILQQVLDGFSIETYDEIEINITFKDHTKLDIER